MTHMRDENDEYHAQTKAKRDSELLIIEALGRLGGQATYGQLLKETGLSNDVLTARLRDMEARDRPLVDSRVNPTDHRAKYYALAGTILPLQRKILAEDERRIENLRGSIEAYEALQASAHTGGAIEPTFANIRRVNAARKKSDSG